mgnify:FL=1
MFKSCQCPFPYALASCSNHNFHGPDHAIRRYLDIKDNHDAEIKDLHAALRVVRESVENYFKIVDRKTGGK